MKKTLILLAMVAALMILPFFINHGGEFGGSDGEAESQIQVVAPDYQPWFQPLYEPASGGDFLHSRICEGQTAP